MSPTPVPFFHVDGRPPADRRRRVAAALWRASGRWAARAQHLRRVRLHWTHVGTHVGSASRWAEAAAWRLHRRALALLTVVLAAEGDA